MTQAHPLTPAEIRGFNLMSDQVAHLRDFAANPKQRIPYGLEALDEVVLGPAEGEVHTLVARSFVGKSAMATNMMANNPDDRIIFFSLEMPSRQVIQRLYSHVFDVSSQDVQSSITHNALPAQLGELAQRLPKQVVVDRPNLGLSDMSAYLERYDLFFGHRPDLVIMDYLEEIGGAKAGAEGWIRTEATASAVKTWAKDEMVGVFLLHQANQKTEPWEPVGASSAKGAGHSEADVVIGAWRPGRDPYLGGVAQAQQANLLYLNVLKNRVTGELRNELRFTLDNAMRIRSEQVRLPVAERTYAYAG